MRILHTVELYHPSVGGAQEVVKQVSERLVRAGHEVTVATTRLPERTATAINGVHIEQFAIAGNAVRGITGDADAYREFLLRSKFDVMMNYAAQQWATDLVFPLLTELPYPAVLAPCGFSGLPNPQYVQYFEDLPTMMRQYAHLILHSDTYRDSRFIQQHGLEHYTVVPNGASEAEFAAPDRDFRRRFNIAADVPLLLTIGSHTGQKGHRLAIESFRRAGIGRAVLVVIGNTFGRYSGCLWDCRRRAARATALSLGQKRVLVIDPPRSDVIAALKAADLFVFGSNIECSPLVLFEAMAARTAFVTLACGNAAEIVAWGGGGVVVPTQRRDDGYVDTDVATMAAHIEALMVDRTTRQGLADAGHRAWHERFTWEKIAGEYARVYEQVIRTRSLVPC